MLRGRAVRLGQKESRNNLLTFNSKRDKTKASAIEQLFGPAKSVV